MINLEKIQNCSGCSACSMICPQQCISMTADIEGFLIPVVDSEKCIECGICEEACPIINPIKKNEIPTIFAMYSLDNMVREKSSSGGMFYYLADFVLTDGGSVFGAALENKKVQHIGIDDKKDIKKLMGSKYVQSNLGDTFKKVNDILHNKQKVLFSGTPCQVAGLFAYLNQKRTSVENLYTVDLVCHGVPSPKVFEEYCALIEKKKENKIKNLSFRDKSKGWKNFCLKIEFENGQTLCEPAGKNMYMKGFLTNLFLRKSCFNCSFKGAERHSDITLADFWGINHVLPKFKDDDLGVSMVMVNSEKGMALIEEICKQGSLYKMPVNDCMTALKENSASIASVKINSYSTKFWNDFEKYGLEKAFTRYSRSKLPEEIYYKIRGFGGRLLKQIWKRR